MPQVVKHRIFFSSIFCRDLLFYAI